MQGWSTPAAFPIVGRFAARTPASASWRLVPVEPFCSSAAVLAPGMRDNTPMATAGQADLSRITVVPGQRSGQPCIRGLRVTVWDVLDMLASGMNEDDILCEYPYLEKADFPAVYAYASHAGRESVSR